MSTYSFVPTMDINNTQSFFCPEVRQSSFNTQTSFTPTRVAQDFVPTFRPDEHTFSPSEFYPNKEILEFNPTNDSSVSEDNDYDNSNYKKELCKNWLENEKCRYGKLCQFAHGK